MTYQFYEHLSDEVFISKEPVTTVSASDVEFLKDRALENPRKRVRLCAHSASDDLLHEMLIVHARGNYVPPHRHKGKSESFHMIEGMLKIVLFDDQGNTTHIIKMAAGDPDATLFYRLSAPIYHTVIALTELVVFHETTNGPFRREDMEFAPWAPAEDAPPAAQQAYINGLIQKIG